MSRSPHHSPRSRRRIRQPPAEVDNEKVQESSGGYMTGEEETDEGSEDQDNNYDEPDFVRSDEPRRNQGYNTRSSQSPTVKDRYNRSPQSPNDSVRSSDRSGSSLYPDLSDVSPGAGIYPNLSQQRKVARSPPSQVRNAKEINKPAYKQDQGRLPRDGTKKPDDTFSDFLLGLCDQTGILLVLCVFIILLLGIFVYSKSSVSGSTDDGVVKETMDEAYHRELMVKNFTKEMSSLQDSYQKQDGKLWRVLRSATRRMLSDPNPVQPAIILLVSDHHGGQTLSCLAKSFTSLVGKVTDTFSFSVDLSALANMDSNDAKYELDKKLRSGFESGLETVWLKDLHILDGSVAMLLHAYCDNENAPYKTVTIIFTMLINDVNISEVDRASWDSVVESKLESLWLDKMGTDNVHAVLSRVANNIAVVYPEQTDGCH